MITYLKDDLFLSNAKVLVNAVNTVGVMGKGIALTFKQKYPAMYEEYRHLCESGQFAIGDLHLYKSPEKWILNFPTISTHKFWLNLPNVTPYTGLPSAANFNRLRYDHI